MIRCCKCGRFMSNDDILLGYQRNNETEYAHADCVEKESAE